MYILLSSPKGIKRVTTYHYYMHPVHTNPGTTGTTLCTAALAPARGLCPGLAGKRSRHRAQGCPEGSAPVVALPLWASRWENLYSVCPSADKKADQQREHRLPCTRQFAGIGLGEVRISEPGRCEGHASRREIQAVALSAEGSDECRTAGDACPSETRSRIDVEMTVPDAQSGRGNMLTAAAGS